MYRHGAPAWCDLTFLPSGFVMVEYGVRHRAAGDQGSIVLRVIKRVVTNPVSAVCHCAAIACDRRLTHAWPCRASQIVFMVFLGLVWNRAIGPSIPWTIDLALQLAGNAFDACALFCLGASMVGLTSRSGWSARHHPANAHVLWPVPFVQALSR